MQSNLPASRPWLCASCASCREALQVTDTLVERNLGTSESLVGLSWPPRDTNTCQTPLFGHEMSLLTRQTEDLERLIELLLEAGAYFLGGFCNKPSDLHRLSALHPLESLYSTVSVMVVHTDAQQVTSSSRFSILCRATQGEPLAC